ncbi:MAG: hypothetical protein ABGY11_01095 [Candidatus Thioglobus sp.]|jgi:hypothetical protein
MVKLKGAKKTAFLKRMALGRKKAQSKRITKRKAPSRRRKTTTTRRKTTSLKRTSTKRKTMVSRKRTRSARRGAKGIGSSLKTGMIGEIIKGIGAGSLATIVVGRVAPQYAPIASIGAGFLTGGVVGGAANLLLSGGLTSLGGMFGGASAPAQEFGV